MELTGRALHFLFGHEQIPPLSSYSGFCLNKSSFLVGTEKCGREGFLSYIPMRPDPPHRSMVFDLPSSCHCVADNICVENKEEGGPGYKSQPTCASIAFLHPRDSLSLNDYIASNHAGPPAPITYCAGAARRYYQVVVAKIDQLSIKHRA